MSCANALLYSSRDKGNPKYRTSSRPLRNISSWMQSGSSNAMADNSREQGTERLFRDHKVESVLLYPCSELVSMLSWVECSSLRLSTLSYSSRNPLNDNFRCLTMPAICKIESGKQCNL